MTTAELRADQALDEVRDLQESLQKALAKLIVANGVYQGCTEESEFTNPDTMYDWAMDYAPNADRLGELVKEIVSNPDHYMHPSKLEN